MANYGIVSTFMGHLRNSTVKVFLSQFSFRGSWGEGTY